ncbi:MAG: GAF domain-containing protein [Candidatus Rokuibacteriota bacterium]
MPAPDASREARLRALARLNRLVSASLEPDEVLQAIARAAAELMDVPFVTFWIADEAERRLEVRSFADPTLSADFPVRVVSYHEGCAGWVATHRRAVDVPDVFADPRMFGLAWWRRHGLTSYYAVPVVLGERLLAVLSLVARAPIRVDADDQDLLDNFVAQAAIAIRNARLYAESESRRRGAEALAAVARLLSQTLDVAVVAERIAESVRTILGGLSSAVYRVDEAGDLVVMATSTGEATFEWTLALPRGTGIEGLAVRTKAPVATPDVLADPRVTYAEGSRVYVERSDYRAVLAVPFCAQDRVIGALAVGDRSGRVFDDTALILAQAFADQAAVALENARLFEEALERRRAAEEAEERYRSLFDRVPVGLFRTTRDGRILDANPALVQLLGYADRDGLRAVNAADLYADPEEPRRLTARIDREGVVRDADVQFRRSDGTVIWVRMTARAVHGPGGGVSSYEGSLADVTEARRAAEVARQSEALARVAQLANAAAHEINNPLSVVVGRLHLLERRLRGDATALNHIREAVNASQRITEMIGHMGRITRLEVIEKWSSITPILDIRKSSAPGEEPPRP